MVLLSSTTKMSEPIELKTLVQDLIAEFKDHRLTMKSTLDELVKKIDGITTRVSANEEAIKEHNSKDLIQEGLKSDYVIF